MSVLEHAPLTRTRRLPGAHHRAPDAKEADPSRLLFQRMRILSAMAQICHEDALANASVTRVVKLAGVSRVAFYELFEDRDACFQAAFEEAAIQVRLTISTAIESQPSTAAAVRAGLRAVLALFDQERELAWLLVVESLAADTATRQRRRELLRAVAKAVHERRLAEGVGSDLLAAEGTMGAVCSVVHAHLIDAGQPHLGSLFEPLWRSIVTPYLGGVAPADRALDPASTLLDTSVRESEEAELATTVRPVRHMRTGREHGVRLTYRTARVLGAIAEQPGATSRQIADEAGIADPGQMSKLLARLARLGLIDNTASERHKHGPKAWVLTARGREFDEAIRARFRPLADESQT